MIHGVSNEQIIQRFANARFPARDLGINDGIVRVPPQLPIPMTADRLGRPHECWLWLVVVIHHLKIAFDV